MPKAKSYYYECVLQCELPWYGPDQRKERAKFVGRSEMVNPRTLHVIRCNSSAEKGFNSRNEPIAPDYICVPKPLAKHYTDEITKKVSRVKVDSAYRAVGRVLRDKTSKVKFVLLDPDEVTEFVKRSAYNYGDAWGPEMFEDKYDDVLPPVVDSLEEEEVSAST
jgi:hypothetical protein